MRESLEAAGAECLCQCTGYGGSALFFADLLLLAAKHPPGPMEALTEFLARHPGSFSRDVKREAKFGFSFAPSGYLVRA